MTDRAAFLAAILANPADDLPRLVYADWQEENGAPNFAEFIRVQCQLSRPAGLTDEQLCELGKRELELIDAYWQYWASGYTGYPFFDRGFPYNLEEYRPINNSPRLHDLCIALVTIPEYARHIILPPIPLTTSLEHLMTNPAFAGVHALAFTNRHHTREDFAMLAAQECRLAVLRHLHITGCPAIAGNLRLITESDRLSGLHSLGLQQNELLPDDFAALADDNNKLKHLRRLDVAWNEQLSSQLHPLVHSKALAGLRYLHVFDYRMPENSVDSLVSPGNALRELVYLNTTHSDLLVEALRTEREHQMRQKPGMAISLPKLSCVNHVPLPSDIPTLEQVEQARLEREYPVDGVMQPQMNNHRHSREMDR